MSQGNKKILIIGGGFAGIRVALDLSKKHLKNVKITLVSDRPHFEYYSALYRVVAGKSPLEVCIPLREVFEGTKVEVVKDKIISVSLEEKKVEGESGSHYTYDYLVLALGSETAYYNIPGLKEHSYNLKSISSALRLKNHLHQVFATYTRAPQDDKAPIAHIVIVGAGASGTELAAELATYSKEMALMHEVDPRLVTIDLIEAAPRILPQLPERVSDTVQKRLRMLGVNIFLSRIVLKEEVEMVYMKDMQMRTKTVVWTAGIAPHRLYCIKRLKVLS
jgi:NADH:ubiquinone reductase (H+-translocating)